MLVNSVQIMAVPNCFSFSEFGSGRVRVSGGEVWQWIDKNETAILTAVKAEIQSCDYGICVPDQILSAAGFAMTSEVEI